MEQKYTLIVVDMQPYFRCEKDIIQPCSREIKTAIAHNNHIVFVEFGGCGYTDRGLMDIVTMSDYKYCSVVCKHTNDGSVVIKANLSGLDADVSRFKVCGVYTDQCVFETVKGLTNVYAACNVEVIADAVMTDWTFKQTIYLEKMRQLSRVYVK